MPSITTRAVLIASVLILAGCSRPTIPTDVQPQEYAVYRAYLLRYAQDHPHEKHLFLFQTAGGLKATRKDVDREFGRCLSPNANKAFQTLGLARTPLEPIALASSLLMPDGRSIQVVPSGSDLPEYDRTWIQFSRVSLNRNGNEAYFKATTNVCGEDDCLASTFKLWHATRNGDAWTLEPTSC